MNKCTGLTYIPAANGGTGTHPSDMRAVYAAETPRQVLVFVRFNASSNVIIGLRESDESRAKFFADYGQEKPIKAANRFFAATNYLSHVLEGDASRQNEKAGENL